jgi:hypothetical protein
MKSAFPTLFLLLAVAAWSAPLPPLLFADLKSFFHGDTVPEKAPPPKVTAAVSTAAGVTPDQAVEDFLRAFATAVKAREGARILPRLSEKFMMADLPEGHTAPEMFALGIEQIPGPSEIIVRSVETKGAVRIARVEFHLPNRVVLKTLKFGPEGKLLGSDLFMVRRVHAGDDEANPPG